MVFMCWNVSTLFFSTGWPSFSRRCHHLHSVFWDDFGCLGKLLGDHNWAEVLQKLAENWATGNIIHYRLYIQNISAFLICLAMESLGTHLKFNSKRPQKKLPSQKERRKSSNHPFSGVFAVKLRGCIFDFKVIPSVKLPSISGPRRFVSFVFIFVKVFFWEEKW